MYRCSAMIFWVIILLVMNYHVDTLRLKIRGLVGYTANTCLNTCRQIPRCLSQSRVGRLNN